MWEYATFVVDFLYNNIINNNIINISQDSMYTRKLVHLPATINHPCRFEVVQILLERQLAVGRHRLE